MEAALQRLLFSGEDKLFLLASMLDKYLSQQNFDVESTRPAGFWIRFAAYFIDFLILLVFAVASLFMKSVGAYLLLVIPLIAYKPVLEGLLGGTAGKLALGLRVINSQGQRLGLAGAFVRSGLFILPIIPNILIQTRMIEESVSPLDPEAVKAFQDANELLYLAYYALSILLLVSCIVAAFQRRKRALHDMIADSYVIYHEGEGAAQ